MTKIMRAMAVIMMVVGAILLLVGLLAPDVVGGGGLHSTEETVYKLPSIAMIIAGTFLLTAGLMFFFLREEYKPLPEVVAHKEEVAPKVVEEEKKEAVEAAPKEESRTGISSEDYLVLRLLNGDERLMFRAIIDNGGEALQKDLIVKLKWSDAKVSRVIDRLIEKGVVAKERFGVTNKVKVLVDK